MAGLLRDHAKNLWHNPQRKTFLLEQRDIFSAKMAQNGASTFANGNRKPANNGRSDGFSLPGIDENELRARIYAKPQLKPNPRALRFSGPTPVQLKKVR